MAVMASSDRPPVAFDVATRRLIGTIFVVCVSAEIAFVLLDYHVNYARGSEIGAIRRLFNITREDSLPSWFAVTQTWMSALTLWLLYAVVRRLGATRWQITGWLVLALFFTWMAIDDGAKIHERLGTTARVLLERSGDGNAGLDFFPSYAWQVLFVPLFGALGLFTLAFVWRELTDGFSRAMAATGVACLAIAVGLDFVEGLDPDHPLSPYGWLVDRFGLASFARSRFDTTGLDMTQHFAKSVEETLEMFGNTLLWLAFLRHLTSCTAELRVRLLAPAA